MGIKERILILLVIFSLGTAEIVAPDTFFPKPLQESVKLLKDLKRSYDGSGNNQQNAAFGMFPYTFKRSEANAYADGASTARVGRNPR